MSEYFEISSEASKLTDWLSAIAAIVGIPLVVVTLYQLLRKDKEKEKRIASLTGIASSQLEVINKMQGQIDELAKQTSEFQMQTTLMSDANTLLERQLDLQVSVYADSKDIEEKKLDIERRKRLSEIKPYLRFLTGHSVPTEFQVTLLNEGGTVSLKSLIIPEDSFVQLSPYHNREIKKGEKLVIGGYADSSKTYFNSNQVPYTISILMQDEDGNTHEQVINRTRAGSMILSPPTIKENKEEQS